jgi:hypothetical protein
MNKSITSILLLFTLNFAYSYTIPTITVANLFYQKPKPKVVIYRSINDESGNIKTTVNDNNKLAPDLFKNIAMFNSSIKGKLAKTKNFKVIDNPKITNLWHGDTEPIVNYINAIKIQESSVSKTYVNVPDYILLGEITSFTNNTDIEPIQNTDKQTLQFNLDISTSYNLISTKDGAVIASFDVTGNGNDTKIMNQNSSTQKINPNMSFLIKEVADDLSNNVVDEINQQFTITTQTYGIESIESFTVYN